MVNKFTVIALALAGCVSATFAADTPEWQQPNTFRIGQIDPHAMVVPYADNAPVAAIADMKYAESPFYLDLNGQWDFKWVINPGERPVGFQAPDYDLKGWDKITVPGNWQTLGYGTRVYTNETYEFDSKFYNFKKDRPRVPFENNEVGSYRREFTIPAGWEGRRVVLAAEGVSSFFYAWVNGQYLGCNMDSKTAAEWDVTDYLVPGKNVVAFEVYRWSSGSYMECQDMWRLSGIERDVYLYSTPKTFISDFRAVASLDKKAYKDGEFELTVDLQGLPEPPAAPKKGQKKVKAKDFKPFTIGYKLFGANGKIAAEGAENASGIVSLNAVLPDVKAWSAEHPNLYTLELSLNDPEGNRTELVGCNVGFRTTEVKDGLWLMNGKRVIVKGVNRHSWDKLGHFVTPETELRDIELMKLNNINTVRNCHYPATRNWYHLCDKYGIMVIDEVNFESHGYGYKEEAMAKDPMWIPAAMDRTKRAYAKSKNNPSVCFFSLQNESGNGVVFEETYKYMKEVEPNRPIQCERALEGWNTDIYANMYRPINVVIDYASKPENKPYILCEFAHAMGNSVGGLRDYMNVFENLPKAQGGCIWDWVDQSFIETDSLGRPYYTYGGDYGPKMEIPSSMAFCCNGLITSDRKEHPHMQEVKKVYQYAKARMMDTSKLAVSVRNWYDFSNLNELKLNWKVNTADGKVIMSGAIDNVNCAPGDSVLLQLGNAPVLSEPAYLDLSWTTKKASGLVPAGYEVAYDQFTIPAANPAAVVAEKPLKLKKKGDVYSNGELSFTVDPATGAISSVKVAGVEKLAAPIELSLYRPMTENDAAGAGSGKFWAKEGLKNISFQAGKVELKKNVLTVPFTVKGDAGQNVGTGSYAVSILPGNKMDVTTTFDPDTAVVTSLPRVGLTFRVPEADCGKFTFVGRGPVETYNDRNSAGRIGTYTMTPKENFHNYVVPQATGNHTEVSRLTLGDGITITAPELFQAGVTPYDDATYGAPTWAQQTKEGIRGHIKDLKDDGKVTVHIDAAQMGVGTATCGPDVLPQYRVPVAPTTFSFTFSF